MNLQKALAVLATAMGVKGKKEVDVVKMATELHTNEQITAKQLKAIQEMDDEQRNVVKVLLEAMGKVNEEEETPAPSDEEMAAKAAADKAAAAAGPAAAQATAVNAALKTITDALGTLTTTVTNLAQDVKDVKAGKGIIEVVNAAASRASLIDQLMSNDSNVLERADLEAMDVKVLGKLAAAQRPADYSGQGRFASNADDVEGTAPMGMSAALLLAPKKAAAK